MYASEPVHSAVTATMNRTNQAAHQDFEVDRVDVMVAVVEAAPPPQESLAAQCATDRHDLSRAEQRV